MIDHLGYFEDNPAIWNTFFHDFKQSWVDPTAKVDAKLKLENLSMISEGSLKAYITAFNTILAEVGWEKDQPGTV